MCILLMTQAQWGCHERGGGIGPDAGLGCGCKGSGFMSHLGLQSFQVPLVGPGFLPLDL